MSVGAIGSNALQTAAQIARPDGPNRPGDGEDFGQQLMDAIKEVNQTQMNSREMQTALMTGQPAVELHDLMIAMEKASTAMQLTMQVRNKLLEAYQEISRMQV